MKRLHPELLRAMLDFENATMQLMSRIYPRRVFCAKPPSEDDDIGVKLVKRVYLAKDKFDRTRKAYSRELRMVK